MKKLLKVSFVAMLVAAPFAANATPTYGTVPAEPVDATAVADVASTSYVKGAYNAAIAVANAENQRALGVEGTLSNLTTTDKTNLVAAINEINTTAGNALTASQITEGATNGTIAVDGTDVAVHGLGSAAYTASTAYATAAQGALADSAVQSVAEGSANGTIAVDGTDVAVHGLGSAAYTASTDYATAAQGTKADNAETAIGTMANLNVDNTTDLVSAVNAAYTAATTGAVQSVTEGATNGTIAVDGTDVAVHGLGTAAYAATTDFDAAGTAAGLTGTLSNLTTTDKTNLVAAINEVKTTATAAKAVKVHTVWNTNTTANATDVIVNAN